MDWIIFTFLTFSSSKSLIREVQTINNSCLDSCFNVCDHENPKTPEITNTKSALMASGRLRLLRNIWI